LVDVVLNTLGAPHEQRPDPRDAARVDGKRRIAAAVIVAACTGVETATLAPLAMRNLRPKLR
jgi:hypothetical protein